MAASNKIFLKTKDEYDEFERWCIKQEPLQTKYGEPILYMMYLYKVMNDEYYATYYAPNYVNSEVIRRCPIEFIQAQYKTKYSDRYDLIKNGTLYSEPCIRYEIGNHFATVNKPNVKINKNRTKRPWLVTVDAPSNLYSRYNVDITDSRMWYVPDKDDWGFVDEFTNKHITNVNFSVNTIKALQRRIRKWNLPIDSIVTVTDITLTYKYKFKIIK